MIVAIHQPNFFPWLGYFNKIVCSDKFVLLDHVQYAKQGAGSYVNRVKILVQGKPVWITLPVDRTFKGVRPINQIEIKKDGKWQTKIIRTLDFNYSKATYYHEVRDFLEELIMESSSGLSTYNQRNIFALSERLGIDRKKFLLSSSLKLSGSATEMLVEITRIIGGDTYMCGSGAPLHYQNDVIFEREGLGLKYQGFVHPEYPQLRTNEFQQGLSIIDALMNTGFEGTRKLIGL
jgi:hypothetical protein